MANLIFPTAVTEKLVPVDDDVILIADSADGNNVKKLKVENLPFGKPILRTYVNTSGGAGSTTLPSGVLSNNTVYWFKKATNDYNKYTINAFGTDKIESPFTAGTPSLASITLDIPNDIIGLEWDGSYWRVYQFSSTNNISFQAGMSAGQSITVAGGVTILQVNKEIDTASLAQRYDNGGYYNTSTYRFQPLTAGEYNVNAAVTVLSGTSSEVIAYVYMDGIALGGMRLLHQVTANVVNGAASRNVNMNGTTNFIDMRVESRTATRTFGGDSDILCVFGAKLLKRNS